MKKLALVAGCLTVLSAPVYAASVNDEFKAMTEITVMQSMLHFDSEADSQVAGPNGYDKVSAVPLPAAGWMLLAGLGGLAALRRRARA